VKTLFSKNQTDVSSDSMYDCGSSRFVIKTFIKTVQFVFILCGKANDDYQIIDVLFGASNVSTRVLFLTISVHNLEPESFIYIMPVINTMYENVRDLRFDGGKYLDCGALECDKVQFGWWVLICQTMWHHI
jgi:hypothetical protein